jgi:hypothetical protein
MCSRRVDRPSPTAASIRHIAWSPPRLAECGCTARSLVKDVGLPVDRTARLEDEILYLVRGRPALVNTLHFIYSSFSPRRLPAAPANAHLGLGARTACYGPRGLSSLTLLIETSQVRSSQRANIPRFGSKHIAAITRLPSHNPLVRCAIRGAAV